MNTYHRAKRFMFAFLAVFSTMPLWLFVAQEIDDWVIKLVMIGYLGLGGASFLFACPNCGSPLFMRGAMSFPWPNAICSKCGRNLRDSYL